MLRLDIRLLVPLLSVLLLTTADDNIVHQECFVPVRATHAYLSDNGLIQNCHMPGGSVYIIPSLCMRSSFFQGAGNYLQSYPSIGGVVLLHNPSAVDLQYLQLPRTHDEERPLDIDPQKEDELAVRMLQVGAYWWPDWTTYLTHRNKLDEGFSYDFHFPPEVHVGYPSTGGVWVAKYTQDRHYGDDDGGQKSWLPPRPPRWSNRMRYVLSMDEKCEAMKDLGGATFYDKVEDCLDIPKTVQDGKDMFESFRKHLDNMLDRDYFDEFLLGENYVQKPLGSETEKQWVWWKPF